MWTVYTSRSVFRNLSTFRSTHVYKAIRRGLPGKTQLRKGRVESGKVKHGGAFIARLRSSACQSQNTTDDQCYHLMAYSFRSNFSTLSQNSGESLPSLLRRFYTRFRPFLQIPPASLAFAKNKTVSQSSVSLPRSALKLSGPGGKYNAWRLKRTK